MATPPSPAPLASRRRFLRRNGSLRFRTYSLDRGRHWPVPVTFRARCRGWFGAKFGLMPGPLSGPLLGTIAVAAAAASAPAFARCRRGGLSFGRRSFACRLGLYLQLRLFRGTGRPLGRGRRPCAFLSRPLADTFNFERARQHV